MSRKRKRDGNEVDVDLVEIYEQLASEDTGTRIKAAHKLLTKVYRPDLATREQIEPILTRLFRGLCSGRKAARLGFAVALTELLTQVAPSTAGPSAAAITPAEVIDILESQTVVEGGTTGQDERDHYFGRLFGAEAIIKSGILFRCSDKAQWKRLLNSICSLSEKKPWLRQECGWILYQYAASPPNQTTQPFVEDIFKTLISRNLIRTPEGVAIWLVAKDKYPQEDFSDHAWKQKHPLARKDIKSLAEIMKNARSERLEHDHDAQGATIWSANLNFAWEVVLTHLYDPRGHDGSFKEFWQIVVDEGLFAERSSPERKLWGMLVWSMVLARAPLEFLPEVFTRSALHCLITALHGQDRYLRKTSQGVLQALKQRLKAPAPDSSTQVIGSCLLQLIRSTDFADFDNLTKSNAVSDFLDNQDDSVQKSTFLALSSLLDSIEDPDTKKAHLRRRYVIELESKIFTATLKRGLSTQTKKDDVLTMLILTKWLTRLHSSKAFSVETRTFVQDRLATAFEQTLRLGSRGRILIIDALRSLDWRSLEDEPVLQFDDRVRTTVGNAFTKLKQLRKQQEHMDKSAGQTTLDDKKLPSMIEGLMLLYATTLFEVFCGEAEAVEMLDDLLTKDISLLISESSDAAEVSQICDSLVEILLSLASLSSKFLRAVVVQVFESIASKLSQEGIGSLVRILIAKENAQGQQEMFEVADAEDEHYDGSDASESESATSDLDSDVEMTNGTENSPETSEASDSSAESEVQFNEDDAAAAEELAAFDAALASALGTRKSNDNDPDASSSASDGSDMSDSQMLALDEKLAAVFRARKSASSSKQTRKSTKENMVAFKNRILDLVEVYLKQQCPNPVSLTLILPLLKAIRTTQTKQLSDRLSNVMREYCGRCKGQNVPVLPSSSALQDSDGKTTIDEVLSQLRAVHDEACLDTSNAHSAAASQASILLVKVLVRAAGSDISKIIKAAITIYANTRTRQLIDKNCKVQPSFFTDWNNWCANVRGSLAM